MASDQRSGGFLRRGSRRRGSLRRPRTGLRRPAGAPAHAGGAPRAAGGAGYAHAWPARKPLSERRIEL